MKKTFTKALTLCLMLGVMISSIGSVLSFASDLHSYSSGYIYDSSNSNNYLQALACFYTTGTTFENGYADATLVVWNTAVSPSTPSYLKTYFGVRYKDVGTASFESDYDYVGFGEPYHYYSTSTAELFFDQTKVFKIFKSWTTISSSLTFSWTMSTPVNSSLQWEVSRTLAQVFA